MVAAGMDSWKTVALMMSPADVRPECAKLKTRAGGRRETSTVCGKGTRRGGELVGGVFMGGGEMDEYFMTVSGLEGVAGSEDILV